MLLSSKSSSAMDPSDSDVSESHSPSLPSLPASLQQQLAPGHRAQSSNNLAKSGSNPPDERPAKNSPMAMTMKEFDAKLDTLSRENFNLKLRLYFMEKDRNGITKPG